MLLLPAELRKFLRDFEVLEQALKFFDDLLRQLGCRIAVFHVRGDLISLNRVRAGETEEEPVLKVQREVQRLQQSVFEKVHPDEVAGRVDVLEDPHGQLDVT